MGARKRTWDEQEGQQQQREGAAGRGHGAPGASRPNQILPVADLPADFDGTPVDGAQYLAVVRCVAGPLYRLGKRDYLGKAEGC